MKVLKECFAGLDWKVVTAVAVVALGLFAWGVRGGLLAAIPLLLCLLPCLIPLLFLGGRREPQAPRYQVLDPREDTRV